MFLQWRCPISPVWHWNCVSKEQMVLPWEARLQCPISKEITVFIASGAKCAPCYNLNLQ